MNNLIMIICLFVSCIAISVMGGYGIAHLIVYVANRLK